jgi:hypothetical protein
LQDLRAAGTVSVKNGSEAGVLLRSGEKRPCYLAWVGFELEILLKNKAKRTGGVAQVAEQNFLYFPKE